MTQKIGLFQAEILFALISNFLFELISLANIKTFFPLKFFDLRSLSVPTVMLFGHILTFLHYLGHPRLSDTLQAVRHEIPRPKTFANSFLTTFWEKSRIFRAGQWGNFSKYRGFKVGVLFNSPKCSVLWNYSLVLFS